MMRERLRERFCSICCAYWFKTYENCPVRTNVVPVFLKFKMSVRRSTWILPEISKINKFKCIFCIKQSEVTEKYEQAWIDRQAKKFTQERKTVHPLGIYICMRCNSLFLFKGNSTWIQGYTTAKRKWQKAVVVLFLYVIIIWGGHPTSTYYINWRGLILVFNIKFKWQYLVILPIKLFCRSNKKNY